MANSFFSKDIESIKYATGLNKRSVVTFSSEYSVTPDSSDNVTMLIHSAQLQMRRPAQVMRFLNANPALIVGRPSGTLTLQGLFGTAEQIKNICGDPSNPCMLPRTITLQAGVLTLCNSGAEGPNDVGDAEEVVTLYGCVCQGFDLTVQLQQQDGSILQQGTATFVVTDCGI